MGSGIRVVVAALAIVSLSDTNATIPPVITEESNNVASLPFQFTDETRPGYHPLRASRLPDLEPRPKVKGMKLRRLRAQERAERIPAWQAYYEKPGLGWQEAFMGAKELFEANGSDQKALEEAAEWAGWEPDYLLSELRLIGLELAA